MHTQRPPQWMGAGAVTSDADFEAVLHAFANYNRRKAMEKLPEQIERERREAKRRDPKHMKALERRRKRKRGGPK